MKKILVLPFILMGCVSLKQPLKPYLMSGNNVTVQDNVIMVDGKDYAEIKCLKERTFTGNEGEGFSCKNGRGLSIYYTEQKTEKWLFPIGRWVDSAGGCLSPSDRPERSLDEVKARWDGRSFCGDKSFVIFGLFFNGQVIENGKSILFSVPGHFFDVTYEYEMETGKIRKVKKQFTNRLF